MAVLSLTSPCPKLGSVIASLPATWFKAPERSLPPTSVREVETVEVVVVDDISEAAVTGASIVTPRSEESAAFEADVRIATAAFAPSAEGTLIDAFTVTLAAATVSAISAEETPFPILVASLVLKLVRCDSPNDSTVPAILKIAVTTGHRAFGGGGGLGGNGGGIGDGGEGEGGGGGSMGEGEGGDAGGTGGGDGCDVCA